VALTMFSLTAKTNYKAPPLNGTEPDSSRPREGRGLYEFVAGMVNQSIHFANNLTAKDKKISRAYNDERNSF